MARYFTAFLLVVPTLRAADPATRTAIQVPHNELKKLAWQLAVPTGSFPDQSVFQVIDLLHDHDIHHLELTPGQLVDSTMPGIRVSQSMPADTTAALLGKLKSVHMDIVTYGPVEFAADEQSNRAIFTFAKKLKAKNIIISASPASLEQLDKLANEFSINLAIQDSKYKTPADVLAVVANRSSHVGSDGDLSNWAEPVKAIQILDGRLIQYRVQIVNPAVITELKSQAFKGVITVVVSDGTGPAQVDKLVDSVNQLSDALEAGGK